MKKITLLFFKIILALAMLVSTSTNAEVAPTSEKLVQQLKKIKTLQADFIQENYDAKNNLLQKQNGNFKIMESGEFIWNTAAPYEQKIISDGNVLKIFDPDLEQLTIKTLDKKNQVVPLLLFSGEGRAITEQYEISSPQNDIFDLHASNKSSLFEKLQISFKNGLPVSLSIIDSMNQKTLVRFDKIILNQPIKTSLFQFETPLGADVIDER